MLEELRINDDIPQNKTIISITKRTIISVRFALLCIINNLSVVMHKNCGIYYNILL